jgi:periplasmic protein TonB
MEDHKRLIFPAIAAIVLHGFLVSFKTPKHDISKPILMGNPIRVEINAFSPKTLAPKKNVADKVAEVIPRVTSREKIVQKKVLTQPIAVPKRPKKIMIKPALAKKEMIIENKNKAVDLQQRELENQIKDKDIPLVTPTFAHTGNNDDKIKEDLQQERNSPVPIQQTANPKYRQNKQPPYPVMAKRRGYEGEILLNVLVNSKGMVSEIKIIHSSGHLSLDTAALTTVKNWLFTPATVGGRPVNMWVNVPIEFRLKSNGKS